MTGAGAVVALVLLEWTVGWAAVASWSQSWSVIRRGHFRITAYIVAGLAALTYFADRAALPEEVVAPVGSSVVGRTSTHDAQLIAVATVGLVALLYLLVQYSNTDLPGAVAGYVLGAAGLVALYLSAELVGGWPVYLAGLDLVAGAVLMGAVSNGMLLGHWYLNQPGLKPWALARLTRLGLVAVGLSGAIGLVAAGRLAGAETQGAVLGIPGFGDSFGLAFFFVWIALLAFTGIVIWLAHRCVAIRSIQSATGLYYVALLTAGVSEFFVRFLMVNAT